MVEEAFVLRHEWLKYRNKIKGFPGTLKLHNKSKKIEKYSGMFSNSELFCVLKHLVPREQQLGNEQKK